MRLLARWHIWLGWIVAIPILLWTASGLFMALRPIDDVRGTGLRVVATPEPLRFSRDGAVRSTSIREGKLVNQRGRSILIATHLDGSIERIDLGGGHPLAPVSALEARAIVAQGIKGGATIQALHLFDAAHPPLDFRKPMAAWQATLADGTHVYVGRDTGEIEAVRTPFWRAYDLMWGLHIMNLSTREDPFRPLLIPLGIAALIGSALGTALLFRRRRAARRRA